MSNDLSHRTGKDGPTLHLPDTLLLAYVRGTSGEAEALVVACHLTLCGHCQARAAVLEGAAADELLAEEPADLPEGVLQNLLLQLNDEPHESPAPAAINPPKGSNSDADDHPGLPRPLLRYLPEGKLPWRRLLPGIKTVDLPVQKRAQATVRLVRLHPGLIIPHHDHGGPEYTVVFSGGLRDHRGTWHRGDVAVRQPGEQHRQYVEPGEECVALVFNDGALLPTSAIGRLVARLAGEA